MTALMSLLSMLETFFFLYSNFFHLETLSSLVQYLLLGLVPTYPDPGVKAKVKRFDKTKTL
jgi:hypothetical protein